MELYAPDRLGRYDFRVRSIAISARRALAETPIMTFGSWFAFFQIETDGPGCINNDIWGWILAYKGTANAQAYLGVWRE